MSDAIGIDVSKWQGNMDWAKARSAGAEFAFIRAGSINYSTGQCYEDTQFIRNSALAPLEIPFISYYFFFRPQWDANKQADYFTALADGAERNLRLIADVEVDGSLSNAACADSVEQFCERIHENTGQLPKMYTRAAWFNSNVEARSLWPELDLWIARYTTKPKPWGNDGDSTAVTPRDWDTWTFWQHSADGNGRGSEFGAESNSIDMNYFNGDAASLATYSDSLFPGTYQENVYVSRKKGTILRAGDDVNRYVSVLPYQHPVVADGIYIHEPSGKEYLVVGDHLVLRAHCKPLSTE